jgi:dTDP-4-amino-4,6-dideoxygalactose transaminase
MKRKKSVDELALFGGEPAFQRVLHVGQPNIGDKAAVLSRIGNLLDRRWLTNNGPLVQEFEERIADRQGVKHCIAMCNGTIALEIAVRALGMTGEVIVPSFTFIATAHCLQWQELTPVFCDIDPVTHTIDPSQVERLITPRTSGIIGVHLWGNPCNVFALEDISRRHGLKLLFDASHAFGCTHQGRGIGNFGCAEIFSFHATKFINAFEGGAVVTNDDELAEKMRLMRNFGFHGLDNVIYIGTNGKMSEPSAAMGLTSLDSLDDFVDHNYGIYKTFMESLGRLPGIRFFSYREEEKCNFQYVVLEIDEDITGISRDLLISVLHNENVRARRYFYPGCHRMEPYRSFYPNAGLLLATTEAVSEKIICLPTGTNVSPADAKTICQIIECAVSHGPEIAKRSTISSQAEA